MLLVRFSFAFAFDVVHVYVFFWGVKGLIVLISSALGGINNTGVDPVWVTDLLGERESLIHFESKLLKVGAGAPCHRHSPQICFLSSYFRTDNS